MRRLWKGDFTTDLTLAGDFVHFKARVECTKGRFTPSCGYVSSGGRRTMAAPHSRDSRVGPVASPWQQSWAAQQKILVQRRVLRDKFSEGITVSRGFLECQDGRWTLRLRAPNIFSSLCWTCAPFARCSSLLLTFNDARVCTWMCWRSRETTVMQSDRSTMQFNLAVVTQMVRSIVMKSRFCRGEIGGNAANLMLLERLCSSMSRGKEMTCGLGGSHNNNFFEVTFECRVDPKKDCARVSTKKYVSPNLHGNPETLCFYCAFEVIMSFSLQNMWHLYDSIPFCNGWLCDAARGKCRQNLVQILPQDGATILKIHRALQLILLTREWIWKVMLLMKISMC